jgi:hypothetical protein
MTDGEGQKGKNGKLPFLAESPLARQRYRNAEPAGPLSGICHVLASARPARSSEPAVTAVAGKDAGATDTGPILWKALATE